MSEQTGQVASGSGGPLPEVDPSMYDADAVALPEAFTLRGAVQTYLDEGEASRWSVEAIDQAYMSERANQAGVCRIPADDVDHGLWPVDLVDALCRRVAHNLAMRSVPLGIQTTVSAAGADGFRVGGADPEVRRLEAPHRKFILG